MSQASALPQTLRLELPLDVTLKVTQAQFETIAFANRDLRIERSAEGELIVNPPTGGETGHRNIKIAYFLVKWIEEQGGHGIAFDSSTGFKLPNSANRSPDASWIRSERWEDLSPEQRQGFMPLCPDFVIELRSPSDSLLKLQNKLQEYLENGASLGWLINPQDRQVEIYRSGQQTEVLENPETLLGEDILPGFVLDLRRVW
ncbi:MAG: Uma2 family endonuclease [Leptolyngbya sp. SIO1E4]|nr:Uma2 family endonuclease [Leptolyngbya sp. SIO1E4]